MFRFVVKITTAGLGLCHWQDDASAITNALSYADQFRHLRNNFGRGCEDEAGADVRRGNVGASDIPIVDKTDQVAHHPIVGGVQSFCLQCVNNVINLLTMCLHKKGIANNVLTYVLTIC